ncbi:hypothetical protein HDF16_000029 [Granulicella aggregans]|uniref:Uncharacterized protein n=1 Tax=Granulicella aggregans TaxID=474949 RepID=A0A7W7Z8Q0_9BACT|nr:hypothetical protein [Granulicella aggregans]MBB5055360.1 hypothetical protein [Granulicella aggregans]
MKLSNSRILLFFSALFMATLGLIATFAPEKFLGPGAIGFMPTLVAQVAGALYLGFAILNWMAKDNAIGGIYSRPVALGNLLHFFAVAMALVRLVSAGDHQGILLMITLIYVVFAAGFGLLVFGKSPVQLR